MKTLDQATVSINGSEPIPVKNVKVDLSEGDQAYALIDTEALEAFSHATKVLSIAFRQIVFKLKPLWASIAKLMSYINIRTCELCGGGLIFSMRHENYMDCLEHYPDRVMALAGKRGGRREMQRRLANER